MKVGVSFGITLCTDESKRNFARFGFDIVDVEVEGDVEAQAQEAVKAMLTVFRVGNSGMQEAVTTAILESSPEAVGTIREDLGRMEAHVTHLKDKIIPNIVEKVRELAGRLDDRG